MLCTPKSCTLAQSHAYLTVGQANLTVERGCSHCKQCREVERSTSLNLHAWASSSLKVTTQKEHVAVTALAVTWSLKHITLVRLLSFASHDHLTFTVSFPHGSFSLPVVCLSAVTRCCF